MASSKAPKLPLLVIYGSTGTGKSELAVELATRFNGEIVNADAMQMYQGLPIITNKMSTEDQRGIPHHLLGNVSLDERPWAVPKFKEEATRIVSEIRNRGRLPIVVGGTQYYINRLLFDDILVEAPENEGCDVEDLAVRLPILDGPTDLMLEKLREIDPVMAEKWHPSDARKIRRSLEIYFTTGRRASDIYAEQEARNESKKCRPQNPCASQTLHFWVYASRETLIPRLDDRVDRMVQRGLVDETLQIFKYLEQRLADGHVIDQTYGIYQSIGFKQFEPYMRAVSASSDTSELEALRDTAIADTKTATRRYAKSQVRFISQKTLPLLREEGEGSPSQLFLLDSTHPALWKANVVDQAVVLTERFLEGHTLPSPMDLSQTAKTVLAEKIEASQKQQTPCNRTCEQCGTVCLTEERWQMHVKSKGHRRFAAKKKRTALAIVVDRPCYDLIEVSGHGGTRDVKAVACAGGG